MEKYLPSRESSEVNILKATIQPRLVFVKFLLLKRAKREFTPAILFLF